MKNNPITFNKNKELETLKPKKVNLQFEQIIDDNVFDKTSFDRDCERAEKKEYN